MNAVPRDQLASPPAGRLLEGVLALGRDVHLGMDARSIAERFLSTLAELFPRRYIAIRFMHGAGDGERAFVATRGAKVIPAALTGPLQLKRTSVEKTRLQGAAGVAVVDAPAPVFVGAREGFSIPLVAGGELHGALDVGYAEEVAGPPDDEATLIPIANHLSVALRNVRLHAQSTLLKDYLTKLIDHADALIVGIDRNWRITVHSRALLELGGYSDTELTGTDVRDWLPAEARPRVIAAIAHALGGRHTAAIDVELRTKTGRPVRTVWNIAAIGNGRDVEAVVAVGQDITRLKSLERQVIQAEKLATLGQLAAGVVHELNNPLTSVIVYADYLVKKLERVQAGATHVEHGDIEKVRRILEGAERILNFSRNLVQYAKPSSEEVDVVSLNDVVRQSLSFCEHIVKKSDIEVDVDLADELPPLYAVRGQLQQVLINLLTNAVHALHGAGRVKVSTARVDAGRVSLRVEDSGHGIRAEDVDRIFEPFFTTKTDGKGTGLGLSIVRNIVDAHRGTITVHSKPGEGTTFTIVLPTGR